MNRTYRRAALAAFTMASLTGAVMTTAPAGSTAATGHRLTGITYVEDTWPADTVARKEAIARCPPTLYVVGVGFSAGDFGGNVRIEDVIPSDQRVTVRAEVDEDGPGDTSWALTARAVCANRPPGHRIVSDASAFTSDAKAGLAFCPNATVPLGGGFDLPDVNGHLSVVGLYFDTDRVSTTVYEGDAGFPFNWTIVTYAICSYPIDGWEILPPADADHGRGSQYETNWCPTGKAAISAAGDFEGGGGNVFLTSLSAYTLPQFGNASGISAGGNDDDDGTTLSYDMAGVALCVSR